MPLPEEDKHVIRDLAREVAEIACALGEAGYADPTESTGTRSTADPHPHSD